MANAITRREALKQFGQGAAAGTAVAAIGIGAAGAASQHPDADLLALGTEFDRQFPIYMAKQCEANDRVDAFLKERGVVPPREATAYQAWWDDYRCEVDPFVTEGEQAASEVDTLANRIRDMPATTFAGFAVKARALRHDLCKWGDNLRPMEDWDWDEQCLERFIQQIDAFATGREGGR